MKESAFVFRGYSFATGCRAIRLLAAFTVLLLVPGCGQSRNASADAIRAVISQDKAAANDISNRMGFWERIAGVMPERVEECAASLAEIDLKRCPKDFQKAYQRHAKAWQSLAAAYRSGGSVELAGKEVEASWLEVHRIAQEYGVMDAIK